MEFWDWFMIFQALLASVCVTAFIVYVGTLIENKKYNNTNKMENKIIYLDVAVIVLSLIYYLGNIATVLGFVEEIRLFPYYYPLDEIESIIVNTFGNYHGEDFVISLELENTSLWFAHVNFIFFIILAILMIHSFITRKKEKKINKVLIGYYILNLFIVAFIAFCASPVYIEYIWNEWG